MPEPGFDTKTIREDKGISLTDIHRATKIPVHILRAIEEAAFDRLPEPTFSRRFIITYCHYIGIDPASILNGYEAYLAAQRTPSPLVITPLKTFPSHRWTKFRLMGGVILAAAAIFIFSYMIGERIPTTPPPIIPSASPITETPAPATEVPSAQGKVMSITITAREPTWLRIMADDEIPAEILLRPGETISRHATDSLTLDIGNAGGVEVTFQGKSLGTLGKSGEVVHLKFP